MIVVGMDGSDGGRRALRFALTEAALRRCPLVAVRVVARSKDCVSAEDALRTDIASVMQVMTAPPPVDWEVHIGNPSEVLVRLSTDAELLVVGSHGTGSLIHSALGSVSNACAQLASCPVVVLPRQAERPRET